jgi:hypothetical protein
MFAPQGALEPDIMRSILPYFFDVREKGAFG